MSFTSFNTGTPDEPEDDVVDPTPPAALAQPIQPMPARIAQAVPPAPSLSFTSFQSNDGPDDAQDDEPEPPRATERLIVANDVPAPAATAPQAPGETKLSDVLDPIVSSPTADSAAAPRSNGAIEVQDADPNVLFRFRNDADAAQALKIVPAEHRSYDETTYTWTVAKAALTPEIMSAFPERLVAAIGSVMQPTSPTASATPVPLDRHDPNGFDLSDLPPNVAAMIQRHRSTQRQMFYAEYPREVADRYCEAFDRALVPQIAQLSTINASRIQEAERVSQAAGDASDATRNVGLLKRIFGGLTSGAALARDYVDEESRVLDEMQNIVPRLSDRYVDKKVEDVATSLRRLGQSTSDLKNAVIAGNDDMIGSSSFQVVDAAIPSYTAESGLSREEVIDMIRRGNCPPALKEPLKEAIRAYRDDPLFAKADRMIKQGLDEVSRNGERHLEATAQCNSALDHDDPRRTDPEVAAEVVENTVNRDLLAPGAQKPIHDLEGDEYRRRLQEMATRIKEMLERIMARLFAPRASNDTGLDNDQAPAPEPVRAAAPGMSV